MTVITQTVDGKKIVVEEVSGPSSYPAGGFDLRFRDLTHVERVLSVQCDTGLLCEARQPSENVAKVRVYWPSGASGVPMVEVADGTDLSAVKFTAVGIGY